MFLRNRWYAAARIEEVGRTLLARRILGEPVVLYRTSAGEVAAIEDRCCHRSVPLSVGKLVDDHVQCGYHGLKFDREGRCVFAPGQDRIPAAARVRSYTAVERWGLVWLWMGDPGSAVESLIPDFSITERAGWAASGEVVHLACNYLLAVENLLDLSHISYVHERTIGTPDVARTPVTTTRDGDAVKVTRWMLDVPPPPTYVRLGNLPPRIDRWQIATAQAPCYVWLEVGGAPAGCGAQQGVRAGGIERWNLNCVTPETEKTSHLFWTEVRNFGVGNAEVDETLRAQIRMTLSEDAEILAHQQRTMDANPGAKTIDLAVDAGSIQFRRVIQRKLAEEAQSKGATAKAAP